MTDANILMSDHMGQSPVRPAQRARVVKISLIAIIITVTLLSLGLVSLYKVLTSDSSYLMRDYQEVSLISHGAVKDKNLQNYLILLAERENGVIVAIPAKEEEVIPLGETFTAWKLASAKESTSSSTGVFELSNQDYLLKTPELTLKNSWWIWSIAAGALIIAAGSYLIAIFYGAAVLARRVTYTPRITELSFREISETGFSNFRNLKLKLTPFLVAMVSLAIFSTPLIFTLFSWTTPPGSTPTVDPSIGALAISAFVIVFWGLLLKGRLGSFSNYVFSKLIFGDLGYLSAQVLRYRSANNMKQVSRWLRKSGWHEETALSLLGSFEGSLLELATVSSALGPDPDLGRSTKKVLRKTSV